MLADAQGPRKSSSVQAWYRLAAQKSGGFDGADFFFLEAELGRFLGGCWKDGLCRLMDLDQLKMNRSILDWLAGLLATHPLTDPMLMLGKGSTSTGM